MNLFNKFVPGDQDITELSIDAGEEEQGTNLADLILEKIAAHESVQAREPLIHGGGPPEDAVELPAKVMEVFSK